MADNSNSNTEARGSMVYQIRIEGQLGPQWTDWFEGLTVTLGDDGDTFLTGPVADQAALHGLIKRVRDLGMPLLSVRRVEPAVRKETTDDCQRAGDSGGDPDSLPG